MLRSAQDQSDREYDGTVEIKLMVFRIGYHSHFHQQVCHQKHRATGNNQPIKYPDRSHKAQNVLNESLFGLSCGGESY